MCFGFFVCLFVCLCEMGLFLYPQLRVREHPVMGPYVEDLSTQGLFTSMKLNVNLLVCSAVLRYVATTYTDIEVSCSCPLCCIVLPPQTVHCVPCFLHFFMVSDEPLLSSFSHPSTPLPSPPLPLPSTHFPMYCCSQVCGHHLHRH